MKKLILLVSLISLIFVSACTKTEDELIMVTEAGFAPYEYYNNGEIVGVDIDIANEIAKELNKKLVVKDVSFDFVINEVKSGKADFAAAGISVTEERKKEVDFTIEYTTSNQVVIVRKDSPITSFDQLGDKTLVTQLGTVSDLYVSENYPNANLVTHKKYLSAVEGVKAKKADALIMDQAPALEIVKENSELKILDGILFQDKYGMIVKKGNTELLNSINNVLERLNEEGKIEEYVIKHLKQEETTSSTNFIDNFVDSFKKTFIVEDRYLFFLEGLGYTLIISFFAIILGLFLGVLTSVIRDYNRETGHLKILSKLCDIYVYIIRGTPTLLQLMILYYIIFKSFNIAPIIIGILTFGINSGAYVSEIFRAGFEGIDKGQREASRTLGLNYYKTIRYVIFPQALAKIFPALGNEVITLVKETSIAGYVGIIELIKASDIISSRTYNYFFPLIVSALIYLFLTFLLSKIMKVIERKLNHV